MAHNKEHKNSVENVESIPGYISMRDGLPPKNPSKPDNRRVTGFVNKSSLPKGNTTSLTDKEKAVAKTNAQNKTLEKAQTF